MRALASALLLRCKEHGKCTVVRGRSGISGLLGGEEEVCELQYKWPTVL